MDSEVAAVLARYDQRAEKELAQIREMAPDEIMQRADEFLISIGPATGTLLNVLIKSLQAPTILEIGTSYGHSTIFFAEAARASQGKVISLDVSADKQKFAPQQLAEAGLGAFVEFITGDAREVIASLPGPFDFVLIDLLEGPVIPCFDLVYPKLSDGAFVAADNILFPDMFRDAMLAYRKHVRGKAGIESVLLPVGSGIELSRYSRESV